MVPQKLPASTLFLSQSIFQVQLQYYGVIVFGVVRAVQERNVALLGCIQQLFAGCWIVGKLSPIPALKFLPLGWIVVKPATQIAARRYVLAPRVHLHRLLFQPSWPETFHQESRAIMFAPGVDGWPSAGCPAETHSREILRRQATHKRALVQAAGFLLVASGTSNLFDEWHKQINWHRQKGRGVVLGRNFLHRQ